MSIPPPGPALPRPAVLGALIVIGTWALAVFWVAFTPPATGASSDEAVALLSAEVERLHGRVEALDAQLVALEGAPHSTATDLASVPGGSPGGPATPAAGAEPSTTLTPETTPTPSATPEPTASPTAEPERTASTTSTPPPTATEVPDAIVELGDGDPESPWWTDGRDLWSCHDFESFEEAQEAYRANLPGDPNLIDVDRNGVACESRAY